MKDVKRIYNELKYEATENIKLSKCMICEKECSSFCKSHRIPQFILENIIDNGYMYTSYKFSSLSDDSPLYKEVGKNRCGIFRNICNQCDNTIFQDYETVQNLILPPSNKMMAEIALKNYLSSYYTKKISIEMAKLLPIPLAQAQKEADELDIIELNSYIKKCKTIISNELKSGFKLIWYERLNYVVPMAFQGDVIIYTNFDGTIINDRYNFDSRLKMKYLNLCVFPLENETVIILFRHAEDACYKKFEKKFNTMSLNEKLNFLSWLIVNESEDFYISKEASKVLEDKDLMKKLTDKFHHITFNSIDDYKKKIDAEKNEICNYNSFINILSEKYKIG